MKETTGDGQAWIKWLGGALVGGLAMYLSDPDRGRRRRAVLRDKLHSVAVQSGDAIDVALRDAGNRLRGVLADTDRRLLRRQVGVEDAVLAERVRARIGRAIRHPHPVRVDARNGRVVLSGPVLAHEKPALLHAVRAVPGVAACEDRLDVHQHQDGIPSLQGEGRHVRNQYSMLQQSWPPGWRAAAVLGGAGVALYGLNRRAPANLLLGVLATGLLARAAANRPLLQLVPEVSSAMEEIELYKTVHIEASPATVYDLWSRYENFPRFMSNVLQVRDLGYGRSHWTVSGPGGSRLEWNAEITESSRPWLLAWKSEPGAVAEHTGTLRFEPADTGTRVSVQLSYKPLAGAAGKAFASLFNGNPRRQLEEDLLHMKMFIESHSTARDMSLPQTGQTLH